MALSSILLSRLHPRVNLKSRETSLLSKFGQPLLVKLQHFHFTSAAVNSF
jgi:hypothetical protein